jgi:hypothetical protein
VIRQRATHPGGAGNGVTAPPRRPWSRPLLAPVPLIHPDYPELMKNPEYARLAEVLERQQIE